MLFTVHASKRLQDHGAAPSKGFRSLGWALSHLLVATLWACGLLSLNLSFLICKSVRFRVAGKIK